MDNYKERFLKVLKSLPNDLIKEDIIVIMGEICKKYIEFYGVDDLNDDEKAYLSYFLEKEKIAKKQGKEEK